MTIHEYEYNEIHDAAIDSKPILTLDDITLISDLEVNIDVIIGTASLSISELYALKSGSVITLDQTLDSPVDIKINGNVIARGILSVVDNNYAVKITESVNDKRA